MMKKMRNIIWTWIFDYFSSLLIVSGYEYNYVCLDHLNVWMWSVNLCCHWLILEWIVPI